MTRELHDILENLLRILFQDSKLFMEISQFYSEINAYTDRNNNVSSPNSQQNTNDKVNLHHNHGNNGIKVDGGDEDIDSRFHPPTEQWPKNNRHTWINVLAAVIFLMALLCFCCAFYKKIFFHNHFFFNSFFFIFLIFGRKFFVMY